MQRKGPRRDFTTGSIPKHLLFFSIPMLLGNFLQALYNTVDSIWVGQFLGTEALASVSVSFPVIFAMVALVMGIAMATTTLVAQYYGAGKLEMVQRVISNSILLLGIMGAIISIIGILSRHALLRLINVPPEIIDMAADYLGIFVGGLVVMFLYNVASAILRGLGDSITPLKFLAYAVVMNMILDPVFILGLGPIPKLGVKGVAAATVISQAFSSIIALHYLAKKSGLLKLDKEFFRIDWELTRQTFRIGLPAGVQQILVSLSSLAVGSMVNQYGKTIVAGFGAGARLDQFGFMPAMSIGLAVSALVGQNLGAGRDDRVREIVKWSVIMGGGITALVSLVAIFKPDVLIRLFTDDIDVIDAGMDYLRYVGLSYVPFALMFTFSGVMRGAGDTVATMLITLGGLWLVRVPLARYLSSQPNLGVHGIWLAILISSAASLLLNYGYYKTGRWKKKVVVHGRSPASTMESPVKPSLEADVEIPDRDQENP